MINWNLHAIKKWKRQKIKSWKNVDEEYKIYFNSPLHQIINIFAKGFKAGFWITLAYILEHFYVWGR